MVIIPPHTDVDDEGKCIERSGTPDLDEGLLGLSFRESSMAMKPASRWLYNTCDGQPERQPVARFDAECPHRITPPPGRF